MDQISIDTHLRYLKKTIELARQSPPKPTNFRVGCVIVSYAKLKAPEVLSTGYTLELEGNTHAEQCALDKYRQQTDQDGEEEFSSLFRPDDMAVLYTSLEPCGLRLSGNLPCVQRIIATRRTNPDGGIRSVIFGAKEPGTFVKDSQSCNLLTQAGINWLYLPALEEEILSVAREGHRKASENTTATPDAAKIDQTTSTAVPDMTSRLPRRTEDEPVNRKKRMMEEPPLG